MKLLEPSDLLRPYIKNYRIIESGEAQINRVLPDTSPVLAFRFRGRINRMSDGMRIDIPAFVFTGLNKSARLINYEKDSGTILVLFEETGAAAFFKEPLHEAFGLSLPLDALIHPRQLTMLEEQLADAQDNRQRIAAVEAFLITLLKRYEPDTLILQAVREIRNTSGKIRIKALSDSLYISQDAFEKRFRRLIGTSPKHYASIIRMKSLIYSPAPLSQKLSDLAFDADFFDQAHFNKSFKAFTGQTPADFFRAPVFW